jgi:hypothetical protein
MNMDFMHLHIVFLLNKGLNDNMMWENLYSKKLFEIFLIRKDLGNALARGLYLVSKVLQ